MEVAHVAFAVAAVTLLAFALGFAVAVVAMVAVVAGIAGLTRTVLEATTKSDGAAMRGTAAGTFATAMCVSRRDRRCGRGASLFDLVRVVNVVSADNELIEGIGPMRLEE